MDEQAENERMTRAAACRAAITAYFNTHPNEELSIKQIHERIGVVEGEAVNESTMGYHVRTMQQNGQLDMRKEGNANFYKKPGPKPVRAVSPPSAPVPVSGKQGVSPNEASQITVDIVKQTGRVRLTIKGLVIEIGVVGE